MNSKVTMRDHLPRAVKRVVVPPIKCQGIKTKLVPFIMSHIRWDGRGRWIEPFLGSGAVLFNVRPRRAIANDINPHIINLYKKIYKGEINIYNIINHLYHEGKKLAEIGEEYYYTIRDRFNKTHDPLDFVILNRSCFNGVVRFNNKKEFNVPFCKKEERFSRRYITKIANQFRTIASIMQGKEWEFSVGDWRECLANVREDDFVYLDPPYIGRSADYYQKWDAEDANALAEAVRRLPCGYALSMWKADGKRINLHIDQQWDGLAEYTHTHVYHVGPMLEQRRTIVEALLINNSNGCEHQEDDVCFVGQQCVLPFL